ncbi:pterin dehydratase [Stackebrandtia soli]|uniref:pterin dehydratase n=1 Tax=Stackebrandtia soli TaxID=1892856 RepID=UPI0039E86D41
MTRGDDTLQDALQQLGGWSADSTHISRTLTIDESQHADLTERIKIFADALELSPDVRRFDGRTRIVINHVDGVGLSEVKFAARVEDAYQHLAGTFGSEPHDEPTTGAIRTWWHRRVGSR